MESSARPSLFRFLGSINAAEATVLSFLIASLLGGSILWSTEHDRTIHGKIPVFQEVVITPSGGIATGITIEPRHEMHVFTADSSYKGENFIDTLFTSVSALCVTGLISTDFSAFSLPGQIVTMILIQMGGLGVILFTSLFAFLFVRRLSKRQTFRSMLSSVLDTPEIERMVKHIVFYTVLIEGTGFLVMGGWLQWFADPQSISGMNPWWWALFHSISAFNNAGFSLMSNNLANFPTDLVVNLTIAGLIILGGIGYPVLIAVHTWLRLQVTQKEDREQLQLRKDVADVVASPVQTQVALVGTVILLALGTFIPLLLEWNNPILAHFGWSQRLLIAFFQSTSTRTAGFNTVDIGSLTVATLYVYMILMYIGANPAGTAGGIKIPTIAVLYGYIKDWFKAPGQPVTLFNKKISKFALSHAIRLFFFSLIFLVLVTFFITTVESHYLLTSDSTFNFQKVVFEIFSAFGTVGLSMGFAGGVTSFSAILHPLSKLLIIATMLFGRLGPLTVLASLPWKRTFSDAPLTADYEGAQKIQIG